MDENDIKRRIGLLDLKINIIESLEVIEFLWQCEVFINIYQKKLFSVFRL